MATSGRKLLLVFVAGFLGASLLFALPLVTMRDRVTQLEEEQASWQEHVNASAASQLLEAQRELQAWANETTEPRLVRAAARVDAADHLLGDARGTTSSGLDGPSHVLHDAAKVDECGLSTSSFPPLVHDLGEGLEAAAQGIQNSSPSPLPEAHAASQRLQTTLEDEIVRQVAIEEVLVSGDEPLLEIDLRGPTPTRACLEDLRVETCTEGDRARCTSVSGDQLSHERGGQGWLQATTPALEGEARLEVSVSGTLAGVSVDDQSVVGLEEWPLNGSTLAWGHGSGIVDEEVHVVEEGRAWEELWSRHAGDEQAPEVDFDERTVVAVFEGETGTGCRTVALEVAGLNTNGTVVLRGGSLERGASFCPGDEGSPFHVWSMDRPSGPVSAEVVKR